MAIFALPMLVASFVAPAALKAGAVSAKSQLAAVAPRAGASVMYGGQMMMSRGYGGGYGGYGMGGYGGYGGGYGYDRLTSRMGLNAGRYYGDMPYGQSVASSSGGRYGMYDFGLNNGRGMGGYTPYASYNQGRYSPYYSGYGSGGGYGGGYGGRGMGGYGMGGMGGYGTSGYGGYGGRYSMGYGGYGMGGGYGGYGGGYGNYGRGRGYGY